MRFELTDERHGQDALHEMVLDAKRRTDAASTAGTATDANLPAGSMLALWMGSARSLRWNAPSEPATESPLELLGRHVADLATVAAALHRGRAICALRRDVAGPTFGPAINPGANPGVNEVAR
jgi:hypothetical protein